VIFESGLSARAFGRELEFGLLRGISKVMALFLGMFLLVRFLDLGMRGSLGYAFVFSGAGSYEAWMFWLEAGTTATAVLLVLSSRIRGNPQGLFATSVLALCGFLLNRLNVSTTGLDRSSGVRYFPSWMEAAVTMSIVVIGVIAFRFAATHLPVFHTAGKHDNKEMETPAVSAYAEP
jgi:Ni/Fe-hydrogenase subunit HybB-like protein